MLLLLLPKLLYPDRCTSFYPVNWNALEVWGLPPLPKSLLFLTVQLNCILPDRMASNAIIIQVDEGSVENLHRAGSLGFLALPPSCDLPDTLSFRKICINVLPLTWIIESSSNRNTFEYYMMFANSINGLEVYKNVENCKYKPNIKFIK